MFEYENDELLVTPQGEPQEFTYKGRRFRVHAILERWREAGGWWNRLSTGTHGSPASHVTDDETDITFDDHERMIWRVEAAQIGALATFEIEYEESTSRWKIRPASRPSQKASQKA